MRTSRNRRRRNKRKKNKKNEMNSNANTVELIRDLNICLADRQQAVNADKEKICFYRMYSITNIYMYICTCIQKRNVCHIISLHLVIYFHLFRSIHLS